MQSMQSESRETVRYYVQWFNERTNKWTTPTNELNSGGYETREAVRVADVMDGPPERWPASRIIMRTVTEIVV